MKKTIPCAWLYIVAICLTMFSGHVEPINAEEEPDASHVIAEAVIKAARKEIRSLYMRHAMVEAGRKEAEKVARELVLDISRDVEFSAAFDAAKNTEKFTSLKNEALVIAIKAGGKVAKNVMYSRSREAAYDAAIKMAKKIEFEVNNDVMLAVAERAAREATIDIEYHDPADLLGDGLRSGARKGIQEAVETIRIDRIAELIKAE